MTVSLAWNNKMHLGLHVNFPIFSARC